MAAEPLSLRHRRVLKLLAGAPDGRADGKLIARFAKELVELVAADLVEVRAETVTENGRTIETVWMRITAAGRRAIKS
jgi:hypothetical protein